MHENNSQFVFLELFFGIHDNLPKHKSLLCSDLWQIGCHQFCYFSQSCVDPRQNMIYQVWRRIYRSSGKSLSDLNLDSINGIENPQQKGTRLFTINLFQQNNLFITFLLSPQALIRSLQFTKPFILIFSFSIVIIFFMTILHIIFHFNNQYIYTSYTIKTNHNPIKLSQYTEIETQRHTHNIQKYSVINTYFQNSFIQIYYMSHKILEIKNKQLKQIRRNDRQKIFSANRGWGDQIPVVSLIPSAIEEEDYTCFQQFLDSIQDDQLHLVNKKYVDAINKKWESQQNQQHKQYLFRLKNRLKICDQKWLLEAISLLEFSTNKQIMLKQIAIYLQNQHSESQIRYNQVSGIDFKIYNLVLSYRLSCKEPGPLLYSAYILCKIKWPQKQQLNCIVELVEQCLYTSDEHIQSKAFQLLTKIDLTGDIGIKIAKMHNFNKIVDALNKNSHFQFLLPAVQIISILLSGQEIVMQMLIENYNIVDRLKTFMTHILDAIRFKIYWSFSNIAANQAYYRLLTPMLTELLEFQPKQKNLKIRSEIKFTLLNWCCNANKVDIADKQDMFDFLVQSVRQNNNIFIERVLYAIFNFIDKVPTSKIVFENLSLLPLLEHIYSLSNHKYHEPIQKLLQKIKLNSI